MPSVNRSPRAQRSSIAVACSIAYRIETARSPHPTTTRSVRSRAPSAMAAPSRAPARTDHERHAEPQVEVAEQPMHHRARDHEGDDREERCPQGSLQRHPEPAGEQRNDHQTASDAQETGDEAGQGPDPSEDRGRCRSARSSSLAPAQDRDRLPAEQEGGHDQQHPGIDRGGEPGSQRGGEDAGPGQPRGRSDVDLTAAAVGERAGECGREDHRQRGRERHDRWRPEE